MRLDVQMPRMNKLDRTVCDFARADSKSVLAALESFAWNDLFTFDNPDAAVEMFSDYVGEGAAICTDEAHF